MSCPCQSHAQYYKRSVGEKSLSRVQWNSSYNTESKTKERRSDPTKKEGLTEEEKDSSHSRSLFMKKISVKTNWQKQGFFSKFEQ